jgi:two-component system NtrC family response regulator
VQISRQDGKPMARVLIIDDDQGVCNMLADMIHRLDHEAWCAQTLQEGLEQSSNQYFDAVFLDVNLPDGNGIDALPAIRENRSCPEVIIITGEGDPDGAELAVRNGAWDYLEKPLSPKTIVLPLTRVLQYRDNLKRVQKPAIALNLDGIIGRSPRLRVCIDAIAQAANSEGNVLITGETGTGKELFARAIHQNSPRKDRNFVVVDCAALPETLAESTLFGHERGAYTGADKAREGLIKQAHGGTLFLDEVGELSPLLQKAFLRVLQERRFRPVGAKDEIQSDFRLIAATNRNLDRMVESAHFRKDLLYRLKAMTIELPPLRDRGADVKDLVFHFAARTCERYGTEIKGFSPELFEDLSKYEWPGNIRELLHAVEGSIAEAGQEPILYPIHLPKHIRVNLARGRLKKRPSAPGQSEVTASSLVSDGGSMRVSGYQTFKEGVLAEAEKRYCEDLLAFTRGDINEACKVSGLGRSRLYTLMRKHEVSRLSWL